MFGNQVIDNESCSTGKTQTERTLTQTSTQKLPVCTSEPRIYLQRVLSYTLGQSANVIVTEIEDDNRISVIAANQTIAQSLSVVIKHHHELDGESIDILISDIQGNVYQKPTISLFPESYIKHALIALKNNPLIHGVNMTYDESGSRSPAVLICPTTIQFWNNNLQHPSRYNTLLASTGFELVLSDKLQVFSQGKQIGNA